MAEEISVYKERRAERYMAGVSRSAHRLDTSLEHSLSQDVSLDSDDNCEQPEGREERIRKCKRGSATVLKRLGTIFKQVGTHTGKTSKYRRNNYPDPKKGKAPRNLTSNPYNCNRLLLLAHRAKSVD